MKNMTTEKKITKKAQKEAEKLNKHNFIQEVFMITLNTIGTCTENNRSKLRIQISEQNHNRYIKLMQYGKSMHFLIYTDGNIVLEMKEAFHNDFSQTMFEFSLDTELQREFLERYKEELVWLINEFMDIGILDFHSYMDYIFYENDYRKAYEVMKNEASSISCEEME